MLYNQTKVNGVHMPLLMGCTSISSIDNMDVSEQNIYYDPVKQIVILDTMPKSIHDTMSDRSVYTDPSHHSDRKKKKDDKKFY